MARGRRLKLISEIIFKLHAPMGLRLAERRGLHVYERSLRRDVKAIPSREEWEALFGPSLVKDWHAIARDFVLSQYRLLLIQSVAASGGLDHVVPLVRWKGKEKLDAMRANGEAALLTTWHAGPTIGIWAGLASMGVDLMRVQETRWEVAPEGWTILFRDSGKSNGGPIIKQCLKRLRNGGWVAIPFDSYSRDPGAVMTNLFGRAVPLPRGVTALAEMTGAPLIPLTARWVEGGRALELEVQDPIDTTRRDGENDAGYETRILQSATDRLEAYLRELPHELNDKRLRFLLQQPLFGESAHPAPASERPGG